jgi:hypothetical protein
LLRLVLIGLAAGVRIWSIWTTTRPGEPEVAALPPVFHRGQGQHRPHPPGIGVTVGAFYNRWGSQAADPAADLGLSLNSLNCVAGILHGTEFAWQFMKKVNGSHRGVSAVGVVMKGDPDA